MPRPGLWLPYYVFASPEEAVEAGLALFRELGLLRNVNEVLMAKFGRFKFGKVEPSET